MKRSLPLPALAAGLAVSLAPAVFSVPVDPLPGGVNPSMAAPVSPRVPTVLGANQERVPKESDFPELYAKQFPEKPAPGYQVYALSGGPDLKTPIDADDDITVRLNGEMIFADNDGWKSADERGAKWRGTPITFHAKPGDKISVVLYDLVPDQWGLGPIYLHRADGRHALLQARVEGGSDPTLDNELFTDRPPGPSARRNKQFEASWVIKDLIP